MKYKINHEKIIMKKHFARRIKTLNQNLIQQNFIEKTELESKNQKIKK